MLIECPECKKTVSSAAPACPHCGYVINTETGTKPPVSKARKSSAFQVIAAVGIVLGLFTPRILIVLPVLLVVVMSIVSIARGEPRRVFSVILLVAGVALFLLPSFSSVSSTYRQENYRDSLKIATWGWSREGNYSYVRGRLQNVGHATVNYFEVKSFYRDGSGQVLDMDYTNSCERLPPGMSKEFEIMHHDSPEYATINVAVEKITLE